MKYLILTEGGAEKAIIELLMESKLLIFSIDEMIDMRPHLNRQIENSMLHILIRQLPSDEKVQIIRIGDKMSDKLEIPKDITHKILPIKKCCIKPEFEMLIIINEGLYDDFQKYKSYQKPSEYAKTRIRHNNISYNKSQNWVKAYFKENDLISALIKYKQKSSHKRGEGHLLDLIKKSRKN